MILVSFTLTATTWYTVAETAIPAALVTRLASLMTVVTLVLMVVVNQTKESIVTFYSTKMISRLPTYRWRCRHGYSRRRTGRSPGSRHTRPARGSTASRPAAPSSTASPSASSDIASQLASSVNIYGFSLSMAYP